MAGTSRPGRSDPAAGRNETRRARHGTSSMNSRGTIVVALLAVELAVVGEIAIALRGGFPDPFSPPRGIAQAATEPKLIEDGPHRLFEAGSHPALTVDIGLADLTIVTTASPHIDVSLRSSRDFIPFGSHAVITARASGDAVTIAAGGGHRSSMGDDRMVTVVVPPDTQITVLDAGDIVATGLRGAASLRSVGSGSITLEDYDAPQLQVSARRGEITLRRVVASRLDAETAGGVDATALTVRDGRIESGDDVKLGFAAASDASVTALAKDGDVDVSGLPDATGSSSDEPPSSKTIRIGAGTGHFAVRASGGDITLAQDG